MAEDTISFIDRIPDSDVMVIITERGRRLVGGSYRYIFETILEPRELLLEDLVGSPITILDGVEDACGRQK